MTNFLFRIGCICCLWIYSFNSLFAGLSAGVFAPTFSLEDIDGQIYDLEQLSKDGQTVILHFGTTWCSTCWNLNQSKLLTQINKKYGNAGSKELTILYIESDLNTDIDCIRGKAACGSDTYGDWTRDIAFPIVDLSKENIGLLEDYRVDYYPMIYIITPNRKAFEIDISEEFNIEKYFEESVQLNIEPIIEIDDCTGLSDVSMSVDGGNGRLFFEWSTGSRQSYIEDVEAGEYGVTVTDENGVQQETTISIPKSQHQIQVFYENIKPVSVANGEDGSINLTVKGGIGEVAFYWEHGDQGSTIKGLPTGIYKVAIIDQGGCEIQKTYHITEPENNFQNSSDRDVSKAVDEVNLKIFPNPVANHLQFECNYTAQQVILLNNQGIQLKEYSIASVKHGEIDVSQLDAGIYKIQFIFEEKGLTKAFIKAR